MKIQQEIVNKKQQNLIRKLSFQKKKTKTKTKKTTLNLK